MNKKILQLTVPNIITNITVPLLGMVDMAIVGHLSLNHIAAITIGTSIFNLIYWNFGFLRMGTSGFAAQAYGARNLAEAVRVFVRAMSIALLIALLLIVFQRPISSLALYVIPCDGSVYHLALTYFFIRIWAAPATLGLYALKGWFIGMQNSKTPMWIAIFINLLNIVFSLLFVLYWDMDIAGVAWGTVIAQYGGLIVGMAIAYKYYGKLFRQYLDIKSSLNIVEMKKFFHINADIFLRTFCLAVVFTFITSASSSISKEILAIDALLLQFFTLFSYIMDGFAYAGESLVGRYIGAKDKMLLHKAVKYLFRWGFALCLVFTVLYAVGGEMFLYFFTDQRDIIEMSKPYMKWVLLMPVCGFAAFLWDGIYVGATASKQMRNAMFVATAAFFAIYYLSRYLIQNNVFDDSIYLRNNCLWVAFLAYLLLRGVMQWIYSERAIYKQVE